ncbi:hypothetical protein HQ531_14790 [bacterium]|nr:hypothetical protein [bacterium]
MNRTIQFVTILLASILVFNCDEPKEDIKSPIGNWVWTELLTVQDGEITSAPMARDQIFVQITDSSFIEYRIYTSAPENNQTLTWGCRILEGQFTVHWSSHPSPSDQGTLWNYTFSGSNLIVESPTYPANNDDSRWTLEPFDGILPPEEEL